jgi:alkylated DNA repair dioxygenase AlkB
MSERQRLPNRRAHELLDFEHAGFRFTAGVGRFPDGRLAEIFLNGAKIGTPIDVNARDAAIVASLALQHGTETDEIRHALSRNGDGSAAGPLGAVLDRIMEGRDR